MHVEQKVEVTPTDRPVFGLPVDTSILFSNHKGVYKPRVEKSKTKLLRKLGFLGKFLDADEKIAFVTTGCSPYTTLEQLTMGAVWLVSRCRRCQRNGRPSPRHRSPNAGPKRSCPCAECA